MISFVSQPGLRQTVMGLFGSDGGQPPSNGGPLPITPTPADSNGKQHARRQVVVLPEQLVSSAVMEVSDALSADEPEHLHGQSCLLEDCPPESLRGQYYELSCQTVSHVTPVFKDSIESAISTSIPDNKEDEGSDVANLFELVEVSASVAYMRKVSDGEISCAYVGFSNKTTARQWGDWLAQTHSVASKFTVRPAKRLTAYKHELKLWGVSLKSIERLSECDLSKAPPSNHPPAPKRLPERVPSNAEIDDFKAGDIVKNVSIRNWSYTILSVKEDGFLEVERIGVTPPIRSTINPASVELIRRGGVVEIASQEVTEYLEQQALNSLQQPLPAPAKIDIDDVLPGTRLFLSGDDILVEFEVWMQVEVRVGGRIQKQQREIGKLLETSLGIEARRSRGASVKLFNRTLDAVAYLVSTSSFKPIVPVQTPVLIGAVADIDDDF